MLAAHVLWYRESNPFRCIRNLTKPLDINSIYTLRICLAYAIINTQRVFLLYGVKEMDCKTKIQELRESTGTVSYTHLDVYKRKGEQRSPLSGVFRGDRVPLWPEESKETGGFVAHDFP